MKVDYDPLIVLLFKKKAWIFSLCELDSFSEHCPSLVNKQENKYIQ